MKSSSWFDVIHSSSSFLLKSGSVPLGTRCHEAVQSTLSYCFLLIVIVLLVRSELDCFHPRSYNLVLFLWALPKTRWYHIHIRPCLLQLHWSYLSHLLHDTYMCRCTYACTWTSTYTYACTYMTWYMIWYNMIRYHRQRSGWSLIW